MDVGHLIVLLSLASIVLGVAMGQVADWRARLRQAASRGIDVEPSPWAVLLGEFERAVLDCSSSKGDAQQACKRVESLRRELLSACPDYDRPELKLAA